MDIDGGPAFPQPGTKFEDGDQVARSWDAPGMSLLDFFAAHALGILKPAAHEIGGIAPAAADAVADAAYLLAEAMVRRRLK